MGEKEKSIRKAIISKFPELTVTYGKGRWRKYLHVGRIINSQYAEFTPEERSFLEKLSGRDSIANGFCSFHSGKINLEEVESLAMSQ